MILDFGPRTLPRLGKCPVTELFPAFKHISLCVPPILFVREAIFLLLFFFFLKKTSWLSVLGDMSKCWAPSASSGGYRLELRWQRAWCFSPGILGGASSPSSVSANTALEHPEACRTWQMHTCSHLSDTVAYPGYSQTTELTLGSYGIWKLLRVFLAMPHSSLVPGHRPWRRLGRNPSVWADCAFLWPCLKSEPRCRRSPSVAARCLPEISGGLSTVQLHSLKLGVLILNVSVLSLGHLQFNFKVASFLHRLYIHLFRVGSEKDRFFYTAAWHDPSN